MKIKKLVHFVIFSLALHAFWIAYFLIGFAIIIPLIGASSSVLEIAFSIMAGGVFLLAGEIHLLGNKVWNKERGKNND